MCVAPHTTSESDLFMRVRECLSNCLKNSEFSVTRNEKSNEDSKSQQ